MSVFNIVRSVVYFYFSFYSVNFSSTSSFFLVNVIYKFTNLNHVYFLLIIENIGNCSQCANFFELLSVLKIYEKPIIGT